jgi:hypothetical protein
MIMIVAGNYDQAWYWANEWKLCPCDWRYVDSPNSLKGVRNSEVRFVGDWYRRPDARELELEAQCVMLKLSPR